MKKISFKSFLTTTLSLLLFFTFTSTTKVSAKVNQENDVIVRDGVKFKSTISEDLINQLSSVMINELKKDDGEVISLTKKQTLLDNNEQFNPLLRTMPVSDFDMVVAVQRISEKSGDNFKFVAVGLWNVNPVYEFTDCIGLAWSDDFTLYNDYSYTYTNSTGTSYYSACTRNDVKPEVGVAYDVDLVLGRQEDQVCLVAKVYKANSTGSANVVGEYGHVKLKASSVDVSFSTSDIGMSVGFGASIEKAAPEYQYFNY